MSVEEGINYKKTAPLFLKIMKERFDKDHNPIYLMNAFTMAVNYKLNIPLWVIEKLYEVFKEYTDDENTKTLDGLMGCKRGGGRSPAKTELERRGRDVKIITDMDVLIRHGVKVTDAAKISAEHNKNPISPAPNPEKIRQEYYKWKPELAKIIKYSPLDLPEILESAPIEIKNKKRYTHLFKKYSSPPCVVRKAPFF